MVHPRLELQAMFARSISQRLDATMVLVAGTVECDCGDTCAFGLFGDTFADHCSSSSVAAVANALAHFRFQCGGACQHLATVGRNHLSIDMQVGAMDRQTHSLLFSDSCTGFACFALTRCILVLHI